MLGILGQRHPCPDHRPDRGVEAIQTVSALDQVEERLEDAELRPGVVQRAPLTPRLDALGDAAMGRIGLCVERVAKGQLAHHVDAEALAARRHVDGLAAPAGVQQGAEQGVHLVLHVGLEDAHRALRDDGADDAPFGAVLCLVD